MAIIYSYFLPINMNVMTHLTYRKDIDGLRSIAIIPILFFHAGISGFDGGFIGVDVFFVISGFLITSIIAREIDSDSFSFSNFWCRRIRRLLPTALIVISASLLTGWFLLAPDDYKDLSRSSRNQAFFLSNIHFWKTSGYFDTAAELKPLLHTWSLAVEEQFYIIFPIVFMLFSRFKKILRYKLLTLIAFFSFAISVWLLNNSPGSSFFLLHSRAWELLIGSLLALMPIQHNRSASFYNIVSIVSFAGIIYCILYYTSEAPFPGFHALPPTLCTALLIWTSACHNTPIKRLLSLTPLVWIGLISYSLYLWHWPIIVFTKHWMIEELTLNIKMLLILSSFIAAWLSWRFIERPFRATPASRSSHKKVFILAMCASLIIAGFSQFIRVTKGYPDRLPSYAKQFADARDRTKKQRTCIRIPAEKVANDELCPLGNSPSNQPDSRSIFLWGDSHSDALLPLFDKIATEHQIPGWIAAKSSCLSLIGDLWDKKNNDCEKLNNEVMLFISRHNISDVILVNRWSLYIDGEDNGNDIRSILTPPTNTQILTHYETALLATITQLRLMNINVWLVKQVPLNDYDVSHTLTSLAIKGKAVKHLGVSKEQHMRQQNEINTILDKLTPMGVKVLDPATILCEDNWCSNNMNNKSLYRDDDHLSAYGAMQLEPLFQPLIRSLKHSYDD